MGSGGDELASRVGRVAAAVVAVVGLLGLASWIFGYATATGAGLGLATMKANTALCFVLSAIALALVGMERPAWRVLGRVFSAAVLAIAAATLAQYLFGIESGLDQLLFTDGITPPEKAPGRMSAITAANFLLFGVTGLLPRRGGAIAGAFFTVLATFGLVISLVSVTGYLYETPLLYRPIAASSIAATTATSFVLLFIGLLCTRPHRGIVAVVLSRGAGGHFARRLLPLLVVMPFAIGWLLLRGYQAGWYGNALTVALFSVITLLVIGGATWSAGRRADRLDAERRGAYAARDESDRRLVESEARFRTMVETIGLGIWTEADGRIAYANPAAAALTGAEDATALVGRQVSRLFIEPERAAVEDFLQAARESADDTGIEAFRLLGPEGTLRQVELQAIAQRDGGAVRLLCVCRDVTAQREAENQLRHAQKMQAVGELTGGVAHDFNNLLTVIIGNLEMVVGELSDHQLQAAENALKGAERGATLTQRLLAFSRQQPLAPERLDMNELTTGLEDMMRRSLGETIEIDLQPHPEPVIAFADGHQVENALLNLAINARDAMPEGGKLTIETGTAVLDESYAARNEEVSPGRYVVIAVTDTGSGMPPEVIERAFEPFFTTKATGQGTGLGLSMVYGFVKQSGGHLKIYSELGHGTTVRIYLPSVDAKPEDLAAEDGAEAAAQESGGETILVVEDDPDIRALVVLHLDRLGYEVIEAASGPEALELVEGGQRIDLLFTDVVMPGGMTGRQLSEKLLPQQPRMRTLFTSGYTQNSIVHHGRLDEGISFLSKPYRLRDLGAKVREVLG